MTTTTAAAIDSNQVFVVRTGLLWEWMCVPETMADAEATAAMEHKAALPGDARGGLLADRCYGGFRCGESPRRRHVCIASGDYTYLGTNSPMDKAKRAERWLELINANAGGNAGFVGGGPFTADAPSQEVA